MTYDVKCYEFAQLWLREEGVTEPRIVGALAQRIQQSVEEFVADVKEERR